MKHQFITTLTGVALLAASASAATTSYNAGSLGAAANGTNTDAVTLGLPGVLAAPGDLAVGYSGGSYTSVPYLPTLNPASATPFPIEFWANPSASDNDDATVANRVSSGNRSGWVFFQRAAAVGWNFRMYDGAGSNYGWDLTGGTATLNAWSHVVAVWSGSAATLYVNGTLADDSNTVGLSGLYAASTTAIFSTGALSTALSPSTGLVDETAFYSTALSPAQIAAHYSAASSPVPGAYQSLVLGDGALLHLNNVPEPGLAGLTLLGLAGLLRRRPC